jgi:putative ABC transport system permease protein
VRLAAIALRNVRRNRRRSLLSMTAIAVAAMAITLLFSMLEGMKRDLAGNLQTYVSGEVRLRHRDYDRYEQLAPLHLRIERSEAAVDLVTSHPDVSSASQRIDLPAAIYRGDGMIAAMVYGVDLEREERYQDLSDRVAEGRLPRPGSNQALVGALLARQLRAKVGDRITILATTMRRGSNAITVQVAGLARFPIQALDRASLWIPLDLARRLARMDDSATEILLKLRRGASSQGVASQLRARLAAAGWVDVDAKSWLELPTTWSMMTMASTAYGLMALFFFVLGSSVIVNTTMMVIFERTREIGTVAAMGMTGGQIVGLFFLEALALGAFGSLAGVLLGIGITIPLSVTGLDFGAAMEGVDMEISSVLYPVLNPGSTVLVFFYSTAVAALASLVPASRAARIRPVQALRAT